MISILVRLVEAIRYMENRKNRSNCEVFVTFNKEYVISERTCVGVRDRVSGAWEPVQPNRVLGSVPREERDEEFVTEVGQPRVGDRLCIQMAGRRIVSMPILAVERRLRQC